MNSSEEIKNPWTTLSGEVKYDNPWINVTEYQVINPGGGRGIYGKVHFKNKAIGIVALDADMNTWLVGQFRYTLNEWSWEIPEGGGPFHQSPLEAAKRELQEETGLTAAKWSQILRLHTSNSVTDEEGFIFLAEDLTIGVTQLEETEADMKVWKLSLNDALQMVADGEITDSLSVMGLLMTARIKGI
jgi:8-oxo-dGTP pyrophosphatase MutT (NUDIX family)